MYRAMSHLFDRLVPRPRYIGLLFVMPSESESIVILDVRIWNLQPELH